MGSNFIKYIFKKYPGYKIINLDKLTYAGNLDNLTDIQVNPDYKFIKGDIADEKLVNTIIEQEKPDAVINYAAETHVDRSIMEPRAFLYTDIIGTFNLLEAVRKYGLKRMVQISTDEVYGSIEAGEFTESSPFMPNSPYSASKAGGDHLCRAYWKTYQTPVIVTHSCNFYGPHQYPEKLIPLFITNLLEDKKVPVYGDGLQTREWIFTNDHCQAIDQVLHQGVIGEAYNIGTRQRQKNIEITRLLLDMLGKSENYIEFVTDRPGHDQRYALNSDKLTKDLAWNAAVAFETGLEQAVDWYKTNRWWWEKIKNGQYLEYYKQQYEQR